MYSREPQTRANDGEDPRDNVPSEAVIQFREHGTVKREEEYSNGDERNQMSCYRFAGISLYEFEE